jgi:hypothetical protein
MHFKSLHPCKKSRTLPVPLLAKRLRLGHKIREGSYIRKQAEKQLATMEKLFAHKRIADRVERLVKKN